MKILQIGCGGIGSYLIQEIVECIEQEQLRADVTIADDDMVELKQIKYQNFKLDEIGKSKSKVLSKRFNVFGIKALQKKITKYIQLKNYNLIILCVDNEPTRQMVIEYCHKHHKEFIDLRANGRRIFAMAKEKRIEDNIKFVDFKDLKNYSCQEKADLEKGLIQKGNKIIAMIGIQMLLNSVRGHNNKTISMLV